ncbi:MAG: ATP-binding protein [Nitrospirota bacterium]
MKKSIFRRILWLYIIIFFLSVLFVEIYINAAVRKNHIEDLRKNLSAQIGLISELIVFNKSNLDSICRKLKERTGARVTLITADGTVIGDSDGNSFQMENHAGRPEIQQALLADTGWSIRYSDTINDNLLYVAKRIMSGEKTEGYIRLSIPLREVDKSINLLRMKIALVMTLVLFVIGIFSVWQIEHLRRLIGQIKDFSRSLARGMTDRRLFLKNAGEFGDIADDLNEMSEAMQKTIARSEEEKNRLNVILKSIPDALLIIDSKGTVLISSSASREFFGNVPIAERPFIEIVRNHEFSALMDNVRRDLSSGITEFRLDYPEERYLVVRVSPLFYQEGYLSGFVAIFHDITQIKKLEQMRKDFVANVSHEIKTPITAIKGFADTLLEGAIYDNENAVKFLKTIKSNSERINGLVDDLMMISRIELGVIRVEKSLTDIEDVAENIITMLKDKAAAKNLYLKTANNPALGKIYADRDRLIQILTNLVDNAIKFTETGGVTFGIDEEEGKQFLFVEDTGIGIPHKHLSRLGERFYRVDPARSRKLGGTGLGLAIVKHLVKAHGWSMQIESRPDKGTRVKVMI